MRLIEAGRRNTNLTRYAVLNRLLGVFLLSLLAFLYWIVVPALWLWRKLRPLPDGRGFADTCWRDHDTDGQ